MITNCNFMDSWFDCLYGGLIQQGHDVYIIPDKDYYHDQDVVKKDKCIWNFPRQVGELGDLDAYSVLVIGSIYEELASGKYMDIINNFNGKIVVYQAHDYPSDYDYKSIINKPFIEFRKEYFGEKCYYGTIHPNREEYMINEIGDRFFDICAIFGAKTNGDGSYHPVSQRRIYICDKLQKDFPNSILMPTANLSFMSFRKLTSLAHVGLNMKGLGNQNSRYYEIPSFQSFLVTEKLDCVIPNNFEEGIHKYSFEMPDDYESEQWYKSLVDNIKELLSDKNALKEKTIASYEHTKQFHSLKYNTERFLSVVSEFNADNNYGT